MKLSTTIIRTIRTMPNTFINERHRKYSEECAEIIKKTASQRYSAEEMLARCRRNLGLPETAAQETKD